MTLDAYVSHFLIAILSVVILNVVIPSVVAPAVLPANISDKHSSLLLYGINYIRKKVYDRDFRSDTTTIFIKILFITTLHITLINVTLHTCFY
jgi:hypothetical protein